MSPDVAKCPLGDKSLLAGDHCSRMSRGCPAGSQLSGGPDNQLLGNRVGISLACLVPRMMAMMQKMRTSSGGTGQVLGNTEDARQEE